MVVDHPNIDDRGPKSLAKVLLVLITSLRSRSTSSPCYICKHLDSRFLSLRSYHLPVFLIATCYRFFRGIGFQHLLCRMNSYRFLESHCSLHSDHHIKIDFGSPCSIPSHAQRLGSCLLDEDSPDADGTPSRRLSHTPH